LERSDNPGYALEKFFQTLKGLNPLIPNAFSVDVNFVFVPQGWSTATTLG
jgi:hypothetical protein